MLIGSSEFYIFGESYGGKYAPVLAHRIHHTNRGSGTQKRRSLIGNHDEVAINLAGIGIGNGWMSPLEQGKYANYLYHHGLLGGEQYVTLLSLEEMLDEQIRGARWGKQWCCVECQILKYCSLFLHI